MLNKRTMKCVMYRDDNKPRALEFRIEFEVLLGLLPLDFVHA